MTDWKAVAVDFVIIVVADTGGLVLPVVGQIGTGLFGSFATGYLADGTFDSGAWNDLVAGPISGVVVAPLAALLGSLLGLAGGPPSGLLSDVGVLVTGVVLTLIFAIDSAIAGAAGAWVKG